MERVGIKYFAALGIAVFSFMLLFSKHCSGETFRDEQNKFPRVRHARENRQAVIDTLFASAGFKYPPQKIFLRIFKVERELQLWACDSGKTEFVHIKTYPVTATSGRLGPKRQQGDRQIPEGFYRINHFNPESKYHLSLGINYPNQSDRIRAAGADPGGTIYIHGNQKTIGCIPIGDEAIEELYLIAVDARSAGQKEIPVHIFPYKFENQATASRFEFLTAGDSTLDQFWGELKIGYRYFHERRMLPDFRIDTSGCYVFTQAQKPSRLIYAIVALCDNQSQGIVPVPERLGNGDDPDGNLYWGAQYGLRTFFNNSSGWRRMALQENPTEKILERIIYANRSDEHRCILVADAFRGREIQSAIADYLKFLMNCRASKIPALGEYADSLPGGPPDLLVYIGHDGLMDFHLPVPDCPREAGTPAPETMILACLSKEYFREYVTLAGSSARLWTTGLCSPEAYTLEAALEGWIKGESGAEIVEKAAAAYNRYQKCGLGPARNLWTAE